MKTTPLFRRYSAALLTLTFLTTLLLGACGDSPTTAPATTAAATTAASSATTAANVMTTAAATTAASSMTTAANATTSAANPASGTKGGTAIVAIDSDPETLNLGTTTSFSAGDVSAKIFNGLVWLDANFKPQPSLATSWQISDDAKTYSFKLRSDVTWHDGKPFTSEDVKFTMQEILGKFHPRTQTLIKRIKTIETPDATSLNITLNDPYAPFLIQLSVFEAPILPKHLYEGTDILKNPANLKPIGTGPFKFGEWNRGSTIKVVRNEKYFEPGKPYLDAIVFQVIPQGANRSTGLETGEIDFVIDFYLPKIDVKRLETNTNLQLKRGQGSPAIDFLMFNNKSAALSSKEARQAIAFAINRKRLVDQSIGGLARPARGPFGDGFKWLTDPASDYEKLYALDVEKAKSLLEGAGVKDSGSGRGTLRLVYDAARPQFVSGAQIVRENLKQIGFNLELQPLERTAMIDKVFTKQEFDLTFQSFVSSGDPAIGYHRLYVTNKTTNSFTNVTGYSNPTVDELLTKAAVNPKQEERAALYKQVSAILAVDLPSLVLFDEEGLDFANKKLQGLWQGIDSRDRWQDVTIVGKQ